MNRIKKAPDQDHLKKMRVIAAALFLTALLLVPAHHVVMKNTQVSGDENWLIRLAANLNVQQQETIIRIQPPYETAHIRLTGRNILHAGLRMAPPVRDALFNRGIRLRATAPGSYRVVVEISLQLSDTAHFQNPAANLLSTRSRQAYLADNEWLQLEAPPIEAKLIQLGLNEIEQDELAESIFQFVYKLANHNQSTFRKAPEIISTRSANHRERCYLMAALSRKAGIPARVVTGYELKDSAVRNAVHWVELYVNDGWQSYHPGLGYAGTLPANFIALDKSGNGIVSSLVKQHDNTHEIQTLDFDVSIERVPVATASHDSAQRAWYQVFILERLSLETREQLSLLMLLPLGVLLCSVVRHFAGFHSYGVFTPTMLALAITYADKETTLLILMISLLVVYLGRPAFNRQMSRVPRLSIIFTLVAISIVAGVSILESMSFETDGYLILLPMVIITSLVDRLFSTIELNGYHTAFVRLVWTLILTVITLPVLQQQWLGAFILRYPELHLMTLSTLIILSTLPSRQQKVPAWLGFLVEPKQVKQEKQDKDISVD